MTNAQFPMMWPSPRPMTTALVVGTSATGIELPLVPVAGGQLATLPVPEPRAHAPDSRDGPLPEPGLSRISHDQLAGTTTVQLFTSWAYNVGARQLTNTEHETWQTTDADPGRSRFLGEEWHRLATGGRKLDLRTRIEIVSDSAQLHVIVRRQISRGGRVVREQSWQERLPRQAH